MNIDSFLSNIPDQYKIPYFGGFDDGSFDYYIFTLFVEALEEYLSTAKKRKTSKSLKDGFNRFINKNYLVFDNFDGTADYDKWSAKHIVDDLMPCINWEQVNLALGRSQ